MKSSFTRLASLVRKLRVMDRSFSQCVYNSPVHDLLNGCQTYCLLVIRDDVWLLVSVSEVVLPRLCILQYNSKTSSGWLVRIPVQWLVASVVYYDHLAPGYKLPEGNSGKSNVYCNTVGRDKWVETNRILKHVSFYGIIQGSISVIKLPRSLLHQDSCCTYRCKHCHSRLMVEWWTQLKNNWVNPNARNSL